MNLVESHEVIKEYIFYFEDINKITKVKGRITKLIDANTYFYWVSHHYKPNTNSATVYRPSRTYSDSLEETFELMMDYLNNYTGIDVEIDKDF